MRLCVPLSVALLCVVVLPSTESRADVTLTLGTNPLVDLNNLVVGQTVNFFVTLSSVADSPTGSLGMLNATVQWPGASFGIPPLPAPGPIVPPLIFNPDSGSGFVDGFFLDVGGSQIAADGVFFTFSLTAASLGGGMIGFSNVAALDAAFTPILNAGGSGPLPYNVAAVPEPSSLVMLAAGFSLLGWGRIRARRPRPVSSPVG